VVIGLDSAGNVYVLDAFRDHLTFHEQLGQIISFHALRKPVLVGVEAVAYQAVMGQELIRTSNVPVRQVTPTKDKTTRAREFSVQFENGKVFLDKGMEDLRDELVEFPLSRHDDLVDALMIAMRVALDWGFTGGVKPNIEFSNGPQPYAPTFHQVLEKKIGGITGEQHEEMERMGRNMLDLPPGFQGLR